MLIRDELGLMAFMDTMRTEHFPGLVGAVEYLDSGFELKDRLQSFFNNQRFEGCALFVGLYEGKNSGHNRNNRYVFMGQMTVLAKFKQEMQDEVLATRKLTRETLQKVLGKITDIQEGLTMDAAPYQWEFSVYHQDRVFPVYKPVNVNALGYQIDFNFTIDTSGI